jgi:uncharacterized protein (TIGR00255 family)
LTSRLAMINSMTGFGCQEAEIKSLGKLFVEIKSSNHKFLEIVLHLPESFLSFEERIRKALEARLKRGRVVCQMNLSARQAATVEVNRRLLQKYLTAIRSIQDNLRINEQPRIDTLLNLPGVLTLSEEAVAKEKTWPQLKKVLSVALEDLVRARRREGEALVKHLKKEVGFLALGLKFVRARFKKVIKARAARIKSSEECAAFLKDSDITEELERLDYHLKSFLCSLSRSSPIGKELDFIAQEMQREANTIGAKSCDSLMSGEVVQLKSRIEKIREQAQNVE